MGGLLSPKPKPTVLPPAPAPVPLPDDQTLAAARKKKLVAQSQRGGRMSTILTDNAETLG
jgi:hypothetical protein